MAKFGMLVVTRGGSDILNISFNRFSDDDAVNLTNGLFMLRTCRPNGYDMENGDVVELVSTGHKCTVVDCSSEGYPVVEPAKYIGGVKTVPVNLVKAFFESNGLAAAEQYHGETFYSCDIGRRFVLVSNTDGSTIINLEDPCCVGVYDEDGEHDPDSDQFFTANAQEAIDFIAVLKGR